MREDPVALLRRASNGTPPPTISVDDLARRRARRRRTRRISSIAVGVVALAVSLLVAFELLPHSGKRLGGGGRVRVVPSPYGQAPSGAGDVLDVRGLSDRSAVALTAHAVLSTDDAGVHWNDVTPPDSGAFDFASSRLVTVDQDHWYVASLQPRDLSAVGVFRTGDGGATWSRTDISLPPEGAYSYTDVPAGVHVQAPDVWFADADHGVIQFPSYPFPLYVTSDGGATWNPGPTIPSDVIGHNGPAGVLSIGFSSPSEWWAVADHEYPIHNGDVPVGFLYRSSDGGVTWQPVDLPAPPIEPATDPRGPASEFDNPRFFGQDGVMFAFAATSRTNKAEFAYVTRDGGRSWQATSPVPIEQGAGSPIYMADVLGARTWLVYSTSEQLAVTTDGGGTWNTRRLGSPGPTFVSRVSFTSPQDGWVLDSDGDPDEPFVLWHTSDGGETWQVSLTDHPTT